MGSGVAGAGAGQAVVGVQWAGVIHLRLGIRLLQVHHPVGTVPKLRLLLGTGAAGPRLLLLLGTGAAVPSHLALLLGTEAAGPMLLLLLGTGAAVPRHLLLLATGASSGMDTGAVVAAVPRQVSAVASFLAVGNARPRMAASGPT